MMPGTYWVWASRPQAGSATIKNVDVIVENLLRQALTLDDEGRAAIAGALIESLHGEADPGAEAAWDREIERRVRQIDDGTVKMTPWSEVRKRLFHGVE